MTQTNQPPANPGRFISPIEQVFAKLKHLLRKAAARTQDAVCDTIGTLLNTKAHAKCANYLAHSKYGRR